MDNEPENHQNGFIFRPARSLPFYQPELDQPGPDAQMANDEAFARALQEGVYNAPAAELMAPGVGFIAPQGLPQLPPGLGFTASGASANLSEDTLVDCRTNAEVLFPGIDLDHVETLYNTVSKVSDMLIDHILSQPGSYPKAKEKQLALKRKREIDPDEAAARKYGATDREIQGGYNSIRPYM